MTRARGTALALLGLAVTCMLPVTGAFFAGRDLRAITLFPPPLAVPVDYPRWSWVAGAAVLLPFMLVGWNWYTAPRRRRVAPGGSTVERQPFPWWGWLAVGWTAAWWWLAWTRYEWFATFQRYTFFPLWLGFIVAVNGLSHATHGSCLMTRQPRAWGGLFLVSALFWWMFEWLNRFVGNWHYLAVEDFGAAAYVVHATVCFSTVLPAVAAVAEWLGTRRRWVAGWTAGPAWPWLARRRCAIGLLLAGAGALVFTGLYPRQFYPALWGAPLALALGASRFAGRPGLGVELARGDWSRAGAWAFAALGCGLFWELWNVHSAAKWIYTVPYVQRWHVFEMPLLGYLGYLPFGLECLVVSDWVLRPAGGRPVG